MELSKVSPTLFSRKSILLTLGALILVGGVIYFKVINSSEFNYAGTLETTRIDLPSRVSTVIEEILVQEGEKVKKGQVLASLSCEDLKISSQRANDDFARATRLKASQATSQEAFEVVSTKKKEIDMRLSWCSIESPVDGTVIDRYLEPKEWVNPGSKIISVADLRQIWAYIYVTANEAALLKLNDTLNAEIPELNGKIIQGQIQKINEEAEFTPKNVQTRSERARLVYGVKVAFENLQGSLKPGMTIEVKLK
jgi:HlyD family secretion protein